MILPFFGVKTDTAAAVLKFTNNNSDNNVNNNNNNNNNVCLLIIIIIIIIICHVANLSQSLCQSESTQTTINNVSIGLTHNGHCNLEHLNRHYIPKHS